MESILFLISTPMLAIMFVCIYKVVVTAPRKGERSLPYCIGIILSVMLVFLINISGKTSIETVGEATVVDKLQENAGFGSSYYLIVTDDSHEDRYAVRCSRSVYINHDVGDTVVIEIEHITVLFFIKSEITRVADDLETTPVPEPQSALIRRTSA